MIPEKSLAVFESKKIRRYYDAQTETWYFSVIDVVEALTVSINPTDYLKKLRKRDIELGTYIGTNCPQVEMVTETGKKRKTLGGSVQHILRLVQSIPSPKAEPFKQWLAKVGYERLQDMSDPARSLDRAREYWQQHGRSEKWIQQRMMGQETRNKLTCISLPACRHTADYYDLGARIERENRYGVESGSRCRKIIDCYTV